MHCSILGLHGLPVLLEKVGHSLPQSLQQGRPSIDSKKYIAVDAHKSRSIKWAEKQGKFQPKEMCFFLTSPFIALATPAGWLYEPETPAETDSELPGR